MPRGERMLASGLGVYRFVKIGEKAGNSISLSAPPPQCGGGKGLRRLCAYYSWVSIVRNLVIMRGWFSR